MLESGSMGQANSGVSISWILKHTRPDEEKSRVLKRFSANNFYSLYLMQ